MVWANLKNELYKAVGRAGITQEISATQVVEITTKVIQEFFSSEISSQVTPIYFKEKTLALKTSSSIISQEVRLREKAFLDTLNKKLGHTLIQHIRYVT